MAIRICEIWPSAIQVLCFARLVFESQHPYITKKVESKRYDNTRIKYNIQLHETEEETRKTRKKNILLNQPLQGVVRLEMHKQFFWFTFLKNWLTNLHC